MSGYCLRTSSWSAFWLASYAASEASTSERCRRARRRVSASGTATATRPSSSKSSTIASSAAGGTPTASASSLRARVAAWAASRAATRLGGERHPSLRDVDGRGFARGPLGLQDPDRLGPDLPLTSQQRVRPASHIQGEEGLAHPSAHPPGGREQVEACRLGALARLGDTDAPLARHVDRQLEHGLGDPGRDLVARGRRVVADPHGLGRVGASAGREHAAARHGPLGARDVERRGVVERGQRQRLEVPPLRGPGGSFPAGREEAAQLRRGESPRLEVLEALLGDERLRVKADAPGDQDHRDPGAGTRQTAHRSHR